MIGNTLLRVLFKISFTLLLYLIDFVPLHFGSGSESRIRIRIRIRLEKRILCVNVAQCIVYLLYNLNF
jgi:hypothetical protein